MENIKRVHDSIKRPVWSPASSPNLSEIGLSVSLKLVQPWKCQLSNVPITESLSHTKHSHRSPTIRANYRGANYRGSTVHIVMYLFRIWGNFVCSAIAFRSRIFPWTVSLHWEHTSVNYFLDVSLVLFPWAKALKHLQLPIGTTLLYALNISLTISFPIPCILPLYNFFEPSWCSGPWHRFLGVHCDVNWHLEQKNTVLSDYIGVAHKLRHHFEGSSAPPPLARFFGDPPPLSDVICEPLP